jgi:hypothetical protein
MLTLNYMLANEDTIPGLQKTRIDGKDWASRSRKYIPTARKSRASYSAKNRYDKGPIFRCALVIMVLNLLCTLEIFSVVIKDCRCLRYRSTT